MRRFVTLLLSCCLCLSFSCPVFANSLKPQISTPGNAVMSPGIQNAIDEIQPYAEDPGSIGGSTTSLANKDSYFNYYATDGSFKKVYINIDSDGYFSVTRPSDFDMIYAFNFIFPTSSLPPAGKYLVKFAFASNTGGFHYSAVKFRSSKGYSNSTSLSNDLSMSLSQFSGDFTASISLDVGNPSYYVFVVYPDGNFDFPFGGYLSLRFERLASGASVDNSTAGGATTPQEQVVDKVDSIGSQLDEGFDGIIGAVNGVGDTISGAMGQASDEITENADKNSQAQIDAMEENTNIVTDKLEDVKTGIISGIIDGIKSLFIPDEAFFKSYFDDLYAWFEERLGFLMFPIDLIIQLADVFLGSSDVDCVLTLPSFSISGEQLWAEQSFNLTDFLEEHFMFLLVAIRTVSSIGLVIMFVQLCEKKWEEVMQN